MKKILLLLFIPIAAIGQIVSDGAIKTNTNTLIRNATTVTRSNHSLINDELTDSKMSRLENNQVSGTNTYFISLPWVNSYGKGLTIPVFFTNANTGASTINVSSLGNVSIRLNGNALSGGEIQSNIPYTIIYDGTYFQLVGGGIPQSYIDIHLYGQTFTNVPSSGYSPVWNGTNWTFQLAGSNSVFDATHNGLAPASGGGTTNFLRADGTFATPPGATYTSSNGIILASANFKLGGTLIQDTDVSGTFALSFGQSTALSNFDTYTGGHSILRGGSGTPSLISVSTSGVQLTNNNSSGVLDLTNNGTGLTELYAAGGGDAKLRGSNATLAMLGTNLTFFTEIGSTKRGIMYSPGISGTDYLNYVTNPASLTPRDYVKNVADSIRSYAASHVSGSVANSLTVDNSSLQLNSGTTYNGSAARTISVKNLGITNAMIAASTIDLTTKVTGLLPVANGGTGTASPGLVAGTNVTITGTWPNQTINSSGGSGWATSGTTTVTTPTITGDPTFNGILKNTGSANYFYQNKIGTNSGITYELDLGQNGTLMNGGGYIALNTAGSGYTDGGYTNITIPYSSGTAATALVMNLVVQGGTFPNNGFIFWVSGGVGADATTRWTYSGTLGGTGSGLTLKLAASDLRSTGGAFYSSIDQSDLNFDGQIDAVWQHGYNSVRGARVNTNEAALRIAMESHYIGGGTDLNGNMEFHIESTARNGNINRHLSYGIAKSNGYSYQLSYVDQFNYFSGNGAGGLNYFGMTSAAATTLSGANSRLTITNTTPTTGTSLDINVGSSNTIDFTTTNGPLTFNSTGRNIGFSAGTAAITLSSNLTTINDNNTIGTGGQATLYVQNTHSITGDYRTIFSTGICDNLLFLNHQNTGTGDAVIQVMSNLKSRLWLNNGTNIMQMLIFSAASGSQLGLTNTSAQGLFIQQTNGDVSISDNVITDNARFYVQQNGLSSGWKPLVRWDASAHTALTASTAFPDFDFKGATQTWGSGTIAVQPKAWIEANTLAGTSGTNTATVAAGLQVDSWVVGSNAAITNNYTVYHTGKEGYTFTYTAGGTNGNQTINKPTGSLNIAAAGTTVTLTNNLITTNSIVIPILMTNDTTATSVNAVVSSGSVVFTLNAACTAAVKIGFIVIN